MNKKSKQAPLEEGLLKALKAIDNQVLRLMQKDIKTRDEHGIKKLHIFDQKVEDISSLLLNALGDKEIDLDSVVVLSQALVKVLSFVVSDLGKDGLGKVRTENSLHALNNIERDLMNALAEIFGDSNLC